MAIAVLAASDVHGKVDVGTPEGPIANTVAAEPAPELKAGQVSGGSSAVVDGASQPPLASPSDGPEAPAGDPASNLEASARAWLHGKVPLQHGGRYELKGPHVDRRLTIPTCPTGFGFSHSGDLSGRILIKAECRTRSWSTHFPAEVTLYQEVIATKKSLKRGAVVADADIEHVEIAVSRSARHHMVDPADAVGHALKRSVKAGTILSPGMLALPKAVERGDAVTIVATSTAVEVRTPGVAITGGAVGKQVTVRNVSSNQVIRGWVRAPGLVFVPL